MGAFAISFAVAEWRDDTEDERRGGLSASAPTDVPSKVLGAAEAGEVVEWAGFSLFVDGILGQAPAPGLVMWFTLENIEGDPKKSANFVEPRVVDAQGFDCGAQRGQGRGLLDQLPVGERATGSVYWDCGGFPAKTMTFGQAVELEFPAQ